MIDLCPSLRQEKWSMLQPEALTLSLVDSKAGPSAFLPQLENNWLEDPQDNIRLV